MIVSNDLFCMFLWEVKYYEKTTCYGQPEPGDEPYMMTHHIVRLFAFHLFSFMNAPICSAPLLRVRSICPASVPDLQTAHFSSFTVPAVQSKCLWLSNVIRHWNYGNEDVCWMLIKHKGTDKQIFHKPLLSRTSAGGLVWMLKLAFLTPLVTHLSVLSSSVWYDAPHCLYFGDHLSPYLEESKSFLLVIYKSFSY